ncbi:MAG: hypothetical protein QOD83_2267 [Solirubrobacteraceae bacterium]|jgi:hypothetical protein|nr:hypothetical protein [Solirubrobacteraceae bacterium]
MSTTIRTFILALLLGAVVAPAAQASPEQLSIMMDDNLLVYRDDSTAARALTQMQSLGVDAVRVTVLWKTVAENARFSKAELAKLPKGKIKRAAQKQSSRFKATNPGTYPIRNWDRYDNLVKAAGERGIRIYFNITGPGPAWAHTKPPANLSALAGTYKPKPGAFKQFVQAVGTRFSGTYRDENGSRGTLPRVSFWSLWNEPNQAGWLSPQWEKRGSSVVPASPALFRKLHQYGYRGLVASGHRVDNDVILLGETAPLGVDNRNPKSPMRPGLFLRELACIGPDGTPYSGEAAKARDCGDFDARGGLKANGYAHHPYTKNVPPTVRDPSPDAMTMANASELGTLLDTIASQSNGAIPANLPLFMTEFGFETNPPDPFSGVPLASQAQFNMIGEWQAWSNPRISAQSQFLLQDVEPMRNHKKGSKAYWFTYQSGLYYNSKKNPGAKPAAFAYQLPFLAQPTDTADPATGNPIFTLWGQLRFLKNDTPAVAQIQWKPTDNTLDWQTVGEPAPVDGRGYFNVQRVTPAPVTGQWRAAYLGPDGALAVSSIPQAGP